MRNRFHWTLMDQLIVAFSLVVIAHEISAAELATREPHPMEDSILESVSWPKLHRPITRGIPETTVAGMVVNQDDLEEGAYK